MLGSIAVHFCQSAAVPVNTNVLIERNLREFKNCVSVPLTPNVQLLKLPSFKSNAVVRIVIAVFPEERAALPDLEPGQRVGGDYARQRDHPAHHTVRRQSGERGQPRPG